MNKKDLSERDICSKFISPAIKRVGWDGMLQIPIHVEPLRPNREPYRSSPIATRHASPDRFAFDFAQIVDRMFAAFEEEFFFRWGRLR